MAASAKQSGGTAGVQLFSLERHAREKGMWAGALKRTAIPDLLGAYVVEEGGYRVAKIPREQTPALLKIIDEIVVNASDHKKEHEHEKAAANRVTRITMTFDRETGRIVIENDGPGIPTVVHEEASASMGREVRVPEVVFSFFLAGRNMEKPPDCVKGGVNGIGAKLGNVHSVFFAIETVSDGEVYIQIFRDRMRVREPPKVFSTRSKEAAKLPAERRRPHTRVTFVPAYDEFGYRTADGRLATADADDLEAWCRWRMFLLAAYVGPKVTVLFNGVRCPTTSAKDLAALLVAHDPGAVVMSCTAKAAEAPQSGHPWDVAVAVVPTATRFGHLSVINGVNCAKGTHVTHLKKVLNAAAGARLAKARKSKEKTSVADTCRRVFLVTVGALPGADWGGQRKDELQVSEALVRPYQIPAAALAKISTAVADLVLQAADKGTRVRKTKVEAEKYTGARKAGTKAAATCRLLVAEGDSATALLRTGLKLGRKNPGGPSYDLYGHFSLGGVTMNAMKKITEVETAGGETVIVRSDKLRDNKVLKTLVEILGLDFACRYEADEEVRRLNYGGIIISTDQDLDGTGKILPLVLVWFHIFWPALIARGFVKRFMTPVIRAYPRAPKGAAPLEFFYENDFARWVEGEGGDEAVSAAYQVNYYKGLASHSDEEVPAMFRAFERRTYTFTLNDESAHLFEVYFGKRPSLRKEALSTPVDYLTAEEAEEIHRTREIPCSIQLRVDAKAYKLDDIQRKIPSIIDGIPIARRKVLAGSIRRFANNNAAIRVFQLGGNIAEHMFYHHGDASLNATIIRMAQRFPGALNYPYLTGIGQFGTRHEGGNDAGSPRYVSVRLAAPFAKAMHPAEDVWLLPHVFEDGERAQPQYFVPVLPTALLESFEIPSEGWRHKSYARRLDQVVDLVRAFIGAGTAADAELVARVAELAALHRGRPLPADPLVDELRARFPLDVSLRGYGERLDPDERADLVRPFKSYQHSFGCYRPEHLAGGVTVIRVVELPLRVPTIKFVKDLKKAPGRAELIADIDDSGATEDGPGAAADDGVVDLVRITLNPGAWDEITGADSRYGGGDIDAVEDFLGLRVSLKPFLNYFGEDGRVLEFDDDYHAVFFHWVPVRRDLYRRRLEREAVIVGLRIRIEHEIIRYIGVANELHLARRKDEDAASAALEERGFVRFDSALVRSPQYTRVEALEALATGGVGASFNHILSLRERDLVLTAKSKREAKVRALEARLVEIEALLAERPFAGVSLWAAEVEAVAAAIARGELTDWKF